MNGLRFLLGVLLLAVAASASAEWVKVHEDGEAVAYIDPPTIRTDGEFRRGWRLQDLKKPGEKGQRSVRALMEYDCKGGRQRIVTFTFHGGPMAKGTILVRQDGSGDWTHVPPNTAAASAMRFVCDK